MKRILKGAMNLQIMDGNITNIKRDDRNKLIFFIEYTNVIGITGDEADLQASPFPCTVSGKKADDYEKLFKHGDRVRMMGLASMSEKFKTIKYRVHTLIPFEYVEKEC
jgi:hypothetical protein